MFLLTLSMSLHAAAGRILSSAVCFLSRVLSYITTLAGDDVLFLKAVVQIVQLHLFYFCLLKLFLQTWFSDYKDFPPVLVISVVYPNPEGYIFGTITFSQYRKKRCVVNVKGVNIDAILSCGFYGEE